MATLLVGCGYWGQNWAKTLHALGELAAVCDPRANIQADIQAKYPGAVTYSDLADALNHPGLEAVVLATPVITHRETARQCLLAGKSVLVEKPLTLDPAEAEELVNLAAEKGLVLAVGHLLLYHPALACLKNLMAEGVLGDILSVQCTRINLGKVRNEENVWWSLAPHDLSIISMLLGEPLSVTSAGQLSPLQRPGLEDTVSAGFVTPSGKTASVQVSWLSPFKRHETVVIGSKKIAIFEDTLPAGQKLQLVDYTLERTGDFVENIQRGAAEYVDYPNPPQDLLTQEAQGFLAAVRGQRAGLPNDGRNGAQVVQMLAEVQRILETQQSAARSACAPLG